MPIIDLSGPQWEPSVSRQAHCTRCGHRGTVGYAARTTSVPEIMGRYCFRCWPTGSRAAYATWRAESDAWTEAFFAEARAEAARRRAESGGPVCYSVSGGGPGLHRRGSWWTVLAEVLDWAGLLRPPPARPPAT